jgi:hypothetical protein
MNRRDALKTALQLSAGAAAMLQSGHYLAGRAEAPVARAEASTLYVNPATGSDTNPGTKQRPLRSLAESARRIRRAEGIGPMTIVLSEGIHAIGETTVLKPERRVFSRTDRLTIRAEVMPDDPEWHIGRMPTLIHTLPLSETWDGRPAGLGGAADGMLIETSHVSVLGLRILGMPIVESPQPGLIRRLYGISRLDRSLDDLEIGHCLFAGDEVTAPFHVGVIAHGNGINVHHCLFRGLKISVVYWSGDSTGHAMRLPLRRCVWKRGVDIRHCKRLRLSQQHRHQLQLRVDLSERAFGGRGCYGRGAARRRGINDGSAKRLQSHR